MVLIIIDYLKNATVPDGALKNATVPDGAVAFTFLIFL